MDKPDGILAKRFNTHIDVFDLDGLPISIWVPGKTEVEPVELTVSEATHLASWLVDAVAWIEDQDA